MVDLPRLSWFCSGHSQSARNNEKTTIDSLPCFGITLILEICISHHKSIEKCPISHGEILMKIHQLLSIFTVLCCVACSVGAATPETTALTFASEVADSGDIMGYVSTLKDSYGKCYCRGWIRARFPGRGIFAANFPIKVVLCDVPFDCAGSQKVRVAVSVRSWSPFFFPENSR